jgi:DHA1 family bicyclomycin/chloramphenicol resistance-like MFS transporter
MARIMLLALLAAFPPLATDMYLPALPLLASQWQVSEAGLNLSLAGFFLAYCLTLLFWGPLSDRYGRRIVLMPAICLFIFASFMCAQADGLAPLLFWRVVQGAGCSAPSVIAMALVRDTYQGRERTHIIAWVTMLMVFAPMLSPAVGSALIDWINWQAIFVLQALLALAAFCGVVLMPETLPPAHRLTTPLVHSLKDFAELIRCRQFVGVVMILCLNAMPMFSFIGVASYLYINQYHFSAEWFAWLFAINASGIALGNYVATRNIDALERLPIVYFGGLGISMAGLAMMVLLPTHPFISLTLPMFCVTFTIGLTGPGLNALAIGLAEDKAGAASALLVFSRFMAGAFLMALVPLGPFHLQINLGLIALSAGIAVLLLRKTMGHISPGKS